MFVISINFKNVPARLRERHALTPEKSLELQETLASEGIGESVYLNTCNRCELYGNGDYKKASRVLAEFSQVDLSEMKEYALFYQGDSAIRHLFRVTAGIESMVIGEDEILRQIKDAYETARHNGFTDFMLNTTFQAAMASAKRVKTETMLSKSSVSVATIAADKCHKFIKGQKTVLVIGASGDTGTKFVKNLISYQDSRIYATQRKTHTMEEGLILVPYDERYRYMDEADIIVSATKSPHYTVTLSKLKANGVRPKQRLFVDLAIPRDIDEEVLQVEGSSLITIDEIEELAQQNNELKKAEVEIAEELIGESIDDLRKIIAFREFLPDFERMKSVICDDFSHFVFHYRENSNAEEFISFLNVLYKMEKGAREHEKTYTGDQGQ